VHPLALPCIAMSAINVYLGVYHLILALRRPKAREHLPFALLCLSVASYELFCAGLYSATSLEQGVFWQGLQLQSVAPIAMITVWFIGRLTGTERRTGVRLVLAWFAILAPLTFLRGAGLNVSVATPAVKHITWAGRPLITYHESDLGLICAVVLISVFVAYSYVVLVLIRHYRRKRSRNTLSLLIGNIAYFVGAANDSMISSHVYSFVYISEYAFLVLTLSMAYVLLCQFIDLQSDVEALNVNLERTVAQRTAALQHSLEQQRAMQEQLVAASRRSGMADVATSVLHNLGNALNSVNVSVNLLEGAVRESRLAGLTRVVHRICGTQATSDGAGFFTDDARARRLPDYLTASTAQLEVERGAIAAELASLRGHVEHIKLVVETQQPHAHAPPANELTSLAAVLDEAATASLERHPDRGVELERTYEPVPDIAIDRHKLLEIVASLLDNAWDALDRVAASLGRIRLRLHPVADHRVAIEVEDTGCGIPPENLTRIFHHGFTTSPGRHGFGLHASACATSELGGTLTAASDGPGRGARFTLTLPLRVADRLARVSFPSVDEHRAP